MAAVSKQSVTSVHHWNESLFSFTTTRDKSLRFENGHFVMVGMEVEGKPLMRAYSIASANYEEELEFFSIKVPDGPLTSRLQNIRVGDELLISSKPTGTLVADHLLPGRQDGRGQGQGARAGRDGARGNDDREAGRARGRDRAVSRRDQCGFYGVQRHRDIRRRPVHEGHRRGRTEGRGADQWRVGSTGDGRAAERERLGAGVRGRAVPPRI